MDRLIKKTEPELREIAQYYRLTVPANIDKGRLIDLIAEHEAKIQTNINTVVADARAAEIARGTAAVGTTVPVAVPVPVPVITPTIPKPAAPKGTVVVPTAGRTPRRKAPAQQMTLPLQSDLATLNEVRNDLANIQEINPAATFQKNQPLPAPQPPATKQPATIALPPLTIPAVPVPTAATPKLTIKMPPTPATPKVAVPTVRPVAPSPKITLPLGAPTAALPKTALQATPGKPGATIEPITQLMIPMKAPAPNDIAVRIQLPVFNTRMEALPLPEPTEPTIQPTVAYTAQQMAVLGLASIDPNRLTSTRTKKGDTKYYSVEEMKAIARSHGLRITGSKAELYERIMDLLRKGGYVQ